MKKEEIDKLITESLSKDEAEFYRQFDDEGLFNKWFEVYKGKGGWMAVLLSFFITVFVILAIYCGYRFFSEDTLADMLRYGGGMFIAIMAAGFGKLWLWMQMDKIDIVREMKRIEYQIAVLMEKMSNK